MQPSACGKRYVRVQKTVAGVTHDYIVDGTTILAEITPDYTLRFIYDENGSPIGFVYTPTGSASATYYYEKNLFGDVIAIWEDTGSSLVKVGTYAFNAYGQNVKVTNLTGGTYTNIASLNPFRYRSYYYDADLYLYHLQSRYFDPVSCRFISADGQLNGGNTILGYNMYAYCGNDPINRIDSTGRVWETVFDIVSLGFSIIEVVADPTDIMNWIGLVGDAVDLIPFVSGVGEVTRAVSTGLEVADNIHDAGKAIDNAADAIDGAIDTYKALKKADSSIGKEVYHIVEKRFAPAIGIDRKKTGDMLSIALDHDTHRKFTNLWREAFEYGTNYSALEPEQVWAAAQKVYAGYPNLLEAARKTIFGG